MYVPVPNPIVSDTFIVPSSVRFPVTLTESGAVPISQVSVDPLLSVSSPVDKVPIPLSPGCSVPFVEMVTLPAQLPVPERVAELTITVLFEDSDPVTFSVPPFTVVGHIKRLIIHTPKIKIRFGFCL